MRIGEVAAQSGISAKTIRYYESIGLVAEPARTPSGYRDYDPTVLARLSFIRDAQLAGLRLAEIQSVLELKDAGRPTCEHTRALLNRHAAEVADQIERLQATLTELRRLGETANGLDPASCTDPQRCQVIASIAR